MSLSGTDHAVACTPLSCRLLPRAHCFLPGSVHRQSRNLAPRSCALSRWLGCLALAMALPCCPASLQVFLVAVLCCGHLRLRWVCVLICSSPPSLPRGRQCTAWSVGGVRVFHVVHFVFSLPFPCPPSPRPCFSSLHGDFFATAHLSSTLTVSLLPSPYASTCLPLPYRRFGSLVLSLAILVPSCWLLVCAVSPHHGYIGIRPPPFGSMAPQPSPGLRIFFASPPSCSFGRRSRCLSFLHLAVDAVLVARCTLASLLTPPSPGWGSCGASGFARFSPAWISCVWRFRSVLVILAASTLAPVCR